MCVVLVILDRNIDLIPMLSHSWTYQALVHDVLEMKLNRVSVEVCLSRFPMRLPLEPFLRVADRLGEWQDAKEVVRL
jgi:hypothetical protein